MVAMLVFAVCAALGVALQRDFTLAYQRASNRSLNEQAWSYLRGAEDLAALALRLDIIADDQAEQRRDDLTELWAGDAEPYALDEGGWMLGSLTDLQGRFNLNFLAEQAPSGSGAARFTSAQSMFIRLLQSVQDQPLTEYEAIALTEAIGDWLDVDDNPRLNGAESAFYSARSPAYLPANRPMRSVSELRAVANVTPALYQRLAPLVTVWPDSPAPLNIHTAAPALLRSINVDGSLQPLSEADGERLAQMRADDGFASIDDLLALPLFAGGEFNEVRTLLGESSGFFLLEARVEIADREQRLYSVLRRDKQQVTVLQRARGALL